MPAAKSTKALTESPKRRLVRCTNDRMIAGVACGIAHYFDIDASLVRIAFILITVLGGSGVFAYIILWVVLPAENNLHDDPDDQIKANVGEMRDRAVELSQDSRLHHNRALWGVFLVGLGLVFLLQNFGLAQWLDLGKLWPLLLVVLGFMILSRQERA